MKIQNPLTSSPHTPEVAANNNHSEDLEAATLCLTLSQTLQTILDASSTPHQDSEEIQSYSLSPADRFHWGRIWPYLKEDHSLQEQIYGEILARRRDILAQREHWRPYSEEHKQLAFTDKLRAALEKGNLVPCKEGAGSAYFLQNPDHQTLFVIKPVDEDIMCLNNRKNFANPFTGSDFRVRDAIPHYRSAQTDTLCYQMAGLLGMPDITPTTQMWIIRSDVFHDLTQYLSSLEKEELSPLTGQADNEKLCSVQEFVPDSIPLQQQVYTWMDQGLSEAGMRSQMNPEDFEDANLFIWLTYDTDAHPGNFLLYQKGTKEDGTTIHGIKKIDNGMTFPERNAEFTNFLMYFDDPSNPLSQRMREKITAIPVGPIVEIMNELEMSIPTIVSCIERIRVLQELSKREDISIYEINLRLMLLSKRNGIDEALAKQSVADLEQLAGIATIDSLSSSSQTEDLT